MCDLPETCLTRRVFNWDCSFTNFKGTWSYAVRQVFNEIECPEYFIGASKCDMEYVKSIISLHDDSKWQQKRYTSDKLRYYNLYKCDKSVEDYLLLDLTKYQRSVFAQYRCGILPLQIEI